MDEKIVPSNLGSFPKIEMSCCSCRKAKSVPSSINNICNHRLEGGFNSVFGSILCRYWAPSIRDIDIHIERFLYKEKL